MITSLAVDASARVAQVNEFSVDALTFIAQVDASATNNTACVAQTNELARSVLHLDGLPRAFTRAEPAPDPTCHAPDPPSGDFRIKEVGIAFEPSLERILAADEPGMPGVEVAVVDEDSGGEVIAGARLEVIDRYARR